MDIQNDTQVSEVVEKPKKIWLIVGVTILITALLSSGGIYLWRTSTIKTLNRQMSTERQDFENKLSSLQNEISDLKNKTHLQTNETGSEEISFKTIKKSLSAKTGTEWQGIRVPSTERKDMGASIYELWRFEKGVGRLIESFPIDTCSSIDWDLTADGGVRVDYMTSPCEAFVVNTLIIFDDEGVEQFRMSHNTSEPYFTFKKEGGAEHEVSLIFEGSCGDDLVWTGKNADLPEVSLKGIDVKTTEEEKSFSLSEPTKIDCHVGYGDNISDPLIGSPDFSDDVINFALPNGQQAIIEIKTDESVEIKFQ